MDSDLSFGSWLKGRRKGLDLTQDALAEGAGCSPDMVRKVEGGVARPSRQLAELLVAHLQVPAGEQALYVQWARTGRRQASPPPTATYPASGHDDQAPENPYKGLHAFQETDAPDFFGREALTARLVQRVAAQEELARFLAIVGPSGSGKSSVVRAGLIPALRRQHLPGGISPVVVDMVPGNHPLEEIEAALLRVAVNPPSSLMEQLRDGERGLARAVKRVLPSDNHTEMLLVIDQFEELFTLTKSEQERAQVLRGLFEAVSDPHSRLWVVVTLRADFYDHPLLYIPSSELISRRNEVVGPLTSEELFRAITKPAERAGLVMEADLPITIAEDVSEQPGTLPLMEYALTELFEGRVGRLLTLSAYRQSGGVLGALARRADSLFLSLTPAEQAEARQMFLRLVTLGEELGTDDTRRRTHRAEIASGARDEEALGRVLDLYGRYRMLTFDRDHRTGAPTVQVAHEALVRGWPRFREWLDNAREQLIVHRRLMTSAAEWQSAGQERSFLVSGARLAQFAALQAESESGGEGALALTEEEEAYLAASLDEQRRQALTEQARQGRELMLQKRAASRLRYLVAGLCVFLLVAAALAAWALNRSTEAQTNFEHADALRLGGEAENLVLTHADPNLIALLSIRSLKTAYSPQADAALSGVAFQGVPPLAFEGHTSEVRMAKFSPDGKMLVTGGDDTTVRLWDVATRQTIHIFKAHTSVAGAVAFSPDGKYLATGGDDAKLFLWDLATYEQVREFKGSGGEIGWMAFSPDGKYLATTDGYSGGISNAYIVHIWDVATGEIIRSLTDFKADVIGLGWSPGGNYLYTSALDGTARLWDADNGEQVRSYAGNVVFGGPGAYSPDGKYVAAGVGRPDLSVPGFGIIIWEADTGKVVRVITGVDGVLGMTFSPDSKYIASGGEGTFVQVWEVASGRKVHEYTGSSDMIFWVDFSPDGKYIVDASRDHIARMWSLQTSPGNVVFSGHSDEVWGASYSPDGGYLATSSADQKIGLWDAVSGQIIRYFAGHTAKVLSVVFSPDGKTLLSASADGTVRLWDTESGLAMHTFEGHSEQVNRAFFSHDGTMIVSASDDNTARIWDVATGKELHRFTEPDHAVKAVFSPDDHSLLISDGDGHIELYDVASEKLIRSYLGHEKTDVRASFSPDGTKIVSAGDDAISIVWDTNTGQELQRFTIPNTTVWSAEFSPDGMTVATSGNDNEARLWDVATGQEIRRLTGHTNGVRQVSFSPDGQFVVTASLDKTARIWQTDYHTTINAMCSVLNRDLTREERAQYGITDHAPTCPSH